MFSKREWEVKLSRAEVTGNLSWYNSVMVPKILENKEKYRAVANDIGCPLAMIPLIHFRENGPDIGKFKAYLGNGQPLSKRTTIVPKGRGPFKTWEAGATDALLLMGLDNIKDWNIERMFYELERYNGFGYKNRGIETPYVWSYTNLYKKGKYVADGQFSASAVDKNPGCYAIYKLLTAKDADFVVGEAEEAPIIPKDMGWLEVILRLLGEIIALIAKKKEDGSPKTDEEGPNKEEPPQVLPQDSGMNRNKAILLFGASTIGIKEWKNGSNPEVEKYLDYGASAHNSDSGHSDAVPWCAGWMAYILEANPHIQMGSTNSLMARSYERWGVSSMKFALPGDIVTRYRGVKSKGFGHVHVFCGWHVKNKSYYGMGGNQQDEVNVSIYSMDKVTDFRRSSKQGPFSSKQAQELQGIANQIVEGKPLQGGKLT
jgi:uncharacterized protein (TIGR02594 family)